MDTAPHGGAPADIAALLERVRARDATAIDDLFTHCYPRVLRLVLARMGPKLRMTTDPWDIVQETMLAACERIHELEFHEFGQLIHWLGKTATYRIIGAARADDRLPLMLSNLAEMRSGSATSFKVKDHSRNLSPSSRVERNEEEEELYRALETLSERHREVIYLRDFAQASWSFIAKEMGFQDTPGAHMLHSRAAAKLSAAYKAKRGDGASA